jgi:hypothetical protein
MYVDMPADYRRANQIDDEEINGNRNTNSRNRQPNQVKPQQQNGAANKQQNNNSRQNGPSNSNSQTDHYNNNNNTVS